MWLKLTKTTMEGEYRKVLVRMDSPIRIEEAKIRGGGWQSVIRWLPQPDGGDHDREKPLFVTETVDQIWTMIQGTPPARARKLRKKTG